MPKALVPQNTQKSFLPHEIIGSIYGFLSVSEVLKLRRISRKFNEAAVHHQEDLVDEHRAAAALKILMTQSSIRLSAWRIDFPKPSILGFFIKNTGFQNYLRAQHTPTSSTTSSEMRHLLVVVDTLQTPERRNRYFPLIEQKHLTATEFCNRSLSSMSEFLLPKTINALYDSLLPNCSDERILKEKAELLRLVTTYYQSTADQAQQQKMLHKKIKNLLLISEYKKSKFYKADGFSRTLAGLLVLFGLGFFPLPLYSAIAISHLLGVVLLLLFVATVLVISAVSALMYRRYEDRQKLNPYHNLTDYDMKHRYAVAEPHVKELNTLVSQMGMFKTKEVLDEDELRKTLSQKIEAVPSL